MAMLALVLALAGCKDGLHCPGREPLDLAANYRWLISEQRYVEPLNAWTRNEPLEVFLLKAYREGGLDALQTRYRLACTARTVTPPCESCFTCRRTIAKSVDDGDIGPNFHCQIGEMLIEADVGPGWTISAKTYWRRPPVGSYIPYGPTVERPAAPRQ